MIKLYWELKEFFTYCKIKEMKDDLRRIKNKNKGTSHNSSDKNIFRENNLIGELENKVLSEEKKLKEIRIKNIENRYNLM